MSRGLRAKGPYPKINNQELPILLTNSEKRTDILYAILS